MTNHPLIAEIVRLYAHRGELLHVRTSTLLEDADGMPLAVQTDDGTTVLDVDSILTAIEHTLGHRPEIRLDDATVTERMNQLLDLFQKGE